MSGYSDFVEHFDTVLEEGEKQWLAHEQRRFMEAFALRHGPHLIAGLERLLIPLLQSHIKILGHGAKGEPAGGRELSARGGSDANSDRFDRAASVMNKADAHARRLHAIEAQIREDFPDAADGMIEDLRELIVTTFYEDEKGEA